MKLKLTWLLTLCMAFVMQFSFAQEKTVTGTVTTASDGLPLPGASVIVKGTQRGAQTDFDGKYSISVNAGDILVVSYVGMNPSEITIGSGNVYDVALEEGNALEEVVVVGYGTTTRKANAGTVKVIGAETIEAKSFSNVTQALAGEVAGVTVVNTSGQPGTIGTVRVRGYGSPLGNRNPLYVIDGVPFAGTFDLNSINPADIKSTTLLKDATATAIYGSRGANGVVLITTKTGSRAKAGIVEADIQTGYNFQIIDRYDVLTSPEEYIGFVWEGLYNRGVVTGEADPVGFANGRLLTDNGIGAGYNMWNVPDAASLIDPVTRSVRPGVNRLFTPERYADESFSPGERIEANVRFSGGNENTRYFASVGYFEDKGYSINSDFRRYTGRINVDSNVKDWLKIGANLAVRNSESTNNGQINGSENIFEFADKMAPIYPVFARFPNTGDLIPDPVYGGFQYDYGSPTGATNGFTRNRPNANLLNPVGSATFDFDGTEVYSGNGNIFAHFKFTDWLTLETRFGGQYSFSRRNNASNNVYGTGANTNGNITVTDQVRWSQTFLQLLRFKKSFGSHNIEALVAHETFEQSASFSQQYKQNIVLPGVYNLSNYLESTSPAFGYLNASGLESYFGQVNYNFDNKYFLTGSLRTDGSSRFVNDKWGTFGSIGAAWIASDESFLQDNNWLTYLKLKASWGTTGDQEGVSTTLGFNTFDSNFVGGALALSERRVADPNLTWETAKMLQGGIELSLGSFLDLNLDYYEKTVDNLFFDRRVGSSAGFAFTRVNDGEVIYKGLEFDLTAHLVKNDDFSLDLSINGASLNNEFIRLPVNPTTGASRIIDSGSSLDGNYAYAEGKSLFDFWMREYAGVDPANGSPLWYQYYDDANDNGILDAGEDSFAVTDPNTGLDTNTSGTLFEYRQLVPGANIKKTTTSTYANATQVFLDKSFIPDVSGAFRLSGRYKNFDFSTQFTYSLGGYAYDAQYAELMSDRFGAAGNNFHSDIRNRWQQPGDITNVPILSDNAIVNGTSPSSRFIISTNFIALNNARLGYTIDGDKLNGTGIESIRLWVQGDNLFISSKRDGFNPTVTEVGSSGRRIYAPPSTIVLGLGVKF